MFGLVFLLDLAIGYFCSNGPRGFTKTAPLYVVSVSFLSQEKHLAMLQAEPKHQALSEISKEKESLKVEVMVTIIL